MARRRLALLVFLVLCGVGSDLLPGSAAAASSGTIWLCRPGLRANPCTPGLSTTVFSPTGRRLGTTHPRAVRNPKFDCFYLFPTVSNQSTVQANLHIDSEERSVALWETARYSQYCRVYAPMYRQATLRAIFNPSSITPSVRVAIYRDALRGWQAYLRHYNHGRGVVLIGHSQGTFILRQLIVSEIDPKPAVRARLISAVLLGGNVLVRTGRDVGGDFKHLRACHSRTQLGCVVAFSTFDGPVPRDSKFGRRSSNAALGLPAPAGQRVLCTNPAALGGGPGVLNTIFPTQPFAPGLIADGIRLLGTPLRTAATRWIEVPGAYRARCSSAGGADVLQITPQHGAPTPKPSPDPTWGLHLIDNNVALGNLIDLVRVQGAAYLRRHPG